MANSNSLTSRVYRDGKAVDACQNEQVQKIQAAKSVLVDSCWAWLTPVQMRRIAQQAYMTAQQSCLPDDGRPFYRDGVPYANPDAFLEALTEELRALLCFRFGSPLGGPNFGMLTPLQAAKIACRMDERGSQWAGDL